MLIRDVHLLTGDPAAPEIPRGWLRTAGEWIATLGPGAAPGPEPGERILDGRGRLALPGLVNAHLHSHEHIHRGRFDAAGLASEIREFHPRIAPELGRANAEAEAIRPHVERIYARAVREAGAWGRAAGPTGPAP